MSAFNIFMSYPTIEGYSDFVDITEDVLESSISSIKQALESDDFDIGKITFDNLKLTLRNEESRYSEASNASSIFPLKRDQTIIRIDWGINSFGHSCGNSPCGYTFLSYDRTLFKGLVEENSTIFDVETQNVTFKVLGLDSIINKQPTPFGDLLVTDDANTLVYKILNQPKITQFFEVNPANIDCKNNFLPDDIATLEGKNALESLQDIFLLANSIMYVRDDKIFVKARQETPESQFIFYGASSNEGIENIATVSEYGIGLNRTWNFWFWEDTDYQVSFIDSIELYGERRKGIFSELINTEAKIMIVLNSYLDEFGFPKTELTLTVPMYTPIVDLGFLDQVNIDYPSEVLPTIDEFSSKYNQARYDSGFKYNRVQNSLFISISQAWKILNRKINVKQHEIEFKVREV